MTFLIEFKNHQKETLRALVDKANNKKAVIFVHGFEGTTTKSHYKKIVDRLKGKTNLMRFDSAGNGLSDGSFENMTVEKRVKELFSAIKTLKKIQPKIDKISLITHSLGACVALNFIKTKANIIDKIVFLSPAFNQRELLRYYFVQKNQKEMKTKITWQNYLSFFQESDFQKDLKIKKRETKQNYLSNRYFLENENLDYQNLLLNLDNKYQDFLIVHGDTDDKVPIESNDKLPKQVKKFIVKGGDHDLLRLSMVEQYLDEVVDFLL